MALASYNDYLSAIAGWLNRSDAEVISRIPDFITLAHIRLNRVVRADWVSKKFSETVVADKNDFPLPSDFNGMRGRPKIISNPTITLEYKTPEDLDVGNAINLTGQSGYYTIQGGILSAYPTVGAGSVFEFWHYYKPTIISSVNTSNEYVINCPGELLYACVLEAKPYIKDAASLAMFVDMYKAGYDDLVNQDKSVKYGQGTLEATPPYGDGDSYSGQTG